MDIGGGSNEDDLTVKLQEIIDVNASVKMALDNGANVKMIMENWDFLQVYTTMGYRTPTAGGLTILTSKPTYFPSFRHVHFHRFLSPSTLV